MSDYKDRLKLQQEKDSPFNKFTTLSLSRFKNSIEELARDELILLKDHLDMTKNKPDDYGRKSQMIQNRLTKINAISAPIPTYFMHNAQKVLPEELFEKIMIMARADKTNAKKGEK